MSGRGLRQALCLAACAGIAGVPLAGCGGGGGSKGQDIPSAQAARLIGRLQEAQRRGAPDAFRCHDLQRDTIPALQSEVNNLPSNVKPDIRTTLTDGIDHLNGLVSQQCNQQQATTPTTSTPSTTQSTPSTTQSTPSTSTTNTNTNTNTNTTPSNTNSNTTPSNTNTSGGGTPSPTDTSGGAP